MTSHSDTEGTSVTTQPGGLMSAEILQQPDVFQQIIDHSESDIRALGRLIADRAPKFVVLAGRGTSDHASLYAKYLIEVRLGIPCGLVSPSTVTAYESTMSMGGVLYISVSQSGTSPDLVESLAAARAAGAITIAVTNSPESALAAAAQHHLYVHAGPELAVAATKTYTAELLTLLLFVESWNHAPKRPLISTSSLDGLVTAAALLATDTNTPRALADRLSGQHRLIVTARGYSQPTAAEAALKLVETSYISAHAYSGADLLHGPVAMVSHDFPILVIAPSGPAARSMLEVINVVARRSTEVHVLTDLAEHIAGVHRVPLPIGLDEELHPLVDIILMQRVALEMALAAGNDPDGPRGLLKVTQTL